MIQDAYVQGVSTRSFDDLVNAMDGTSVSKSQASRLCAAIDNKVKAFLDRPLEDDWPYVWLDAIMEVRRNHRIVSLAVIIAVGVNADGRRVRYSPPLSARWVETASHFRAACQFGCRRARHAFFSRSGPAQSWSNPRWRTRSRPHLRKVSNHALHTWSSPSTAQTRESTVRRTLALRGTIGPASALVRAASTRSTWPAGRLCRRLALTGAARVRHPRRRDVALGIGRLTAAASADRFGSWRRGRPRRWRRLRTYMRPAWSCRNCGCLHSDRRGTWC